MVLGSTPSEGWRVSARVVVAKDTLARGGATSVRILPLRPVVSLARRRKRASSAGSAKSKSRQDDVYTILTLVAMEQQDSHSLRLFHSQSYAADSVTHSFTPVSIIQQSCAMRLQVAYPSRPLSLHIPVRISTIELLSSCIPTLRFSYWVHQCCFYKWSILAFVRLITA